MKRHYDFIYLTNTPSFYKLNLCNGIAESHSILLVCTGYDNKAVNVALSDSDKNKFDYIFLSSGDYYHRNSFIVFWRLINLLLDLSWGKLLFSGWMTKEFNIISFFTPKKKNVIICESSIFDTDLSGIKGFVKKRIIKRMSAALPSGKPHTELFSSVGFNGECNITGSVGIFQKGPRTLKSGCKREPLKYVYVGRLVDVKNIGFLIDVFNRNGKPLTIVGDGTLREELEKKAKDNITFTGFIDNSSLGKLYQSHDVFILPSYYEPWGLVVEEALYWGLPVIVSDKVGSSIDMVKDLGTGVIFESNNSQSLESAIAEIEENYSHYIEAVNRIDWEERDWNQINAYISLLD